MLTKRLHVIIEVLAVDQFPCGAESINHVCRMFVSRSEPLGGTAAVKSAFPSAKLIQPGGRGDSPQEDGWTVKRDSWVAICRYSLVTWVDQRTPYQCFKS